MQKLPVVSGKDLIKVLTRLGYQVIRQRGSHVRLCKQSDIGEHNITIPLHKEIANGTLNDILSKVSIWNAVPRDSLIDQLKKP